MCAQSSRNPLHYEETTNYRSYISQIEGMRTLQFIIEKSLTKYIVKKNIRGNAKTLHSFREEINAGKLIHKGDTKDQSFKIAKQKLAEALSKEVNELTKSFLDILNLKNRNNDPLGEDNLLLNGYLATMEGIFKTGESLFENIETQIFGKPHKSALKDAIKEAIKICEQQIEILKYAVDTNVYAVNVPKAEYEKIKKSAEKVYVEGNATVAAKVVGGAALAVASTAATVKQLIFLPTAVANLATGGSGIRLTGKAALESAKMASRAIEGNGFLAKYDFPAEWIQYRDDINSEFNPNYNVSGEFVRIFIVDGKKPQEIFTKGTNYQLSDKVNNHGSTIFFEEHSNYLNDKHHHEHATQAAVILAEGNKYDRLGGWKLSGWKPIERIQVHDEFLVKQQGLLHRARPAVKSEERLDEKVERKSPELRSSQSLPLSFNPDFLPEEIQREMETDAVTPLSYNPDAIPEDVQKELETDEQIEGQTREMEGESEQPAVASQRREGLSMFGLLSARTEYLAERMVESKRQEGEPEELDEQPGMDDAKRDEEELRLLEDQFSQIPTIKNRGFLGEKAQRAAKAVSKEVKAKEANTRKVIKR